MLTFISENEVIKNLKNQNESWYFKQHMVKAAKPA